MALSFDYSSKISVKKSSVEQHTNALNNLFDFTKTKRRTKCKHCGELTKGRWCAPCGVALNKYGTEFKLLELAIMRAKLIKATNENDK